MNSVGIVTTPLKKTEAKRVFSSGPVFLVQIWRPTEGGHARAIEVQECLGAASPAPAHPTLAQDAARPETPHGPGLPAIPSAKTAVTQHAIFHGFK